MLETSKDVLYLTLALAIAVLTFFIVWAIYYLVMILKKFSELVKEFESMIASAKEKLERLESLCNTIEERIKHSASYLPLLFKGITELVDYLKNKKTKKEKQKNNKS